MILLGDESAEVTVEESAIPFGSTTVMLISAVSAIGVHLIWTNKKIEC